MYLSSLVKCPCKSFAHFLSGLVIFLLLSYKNSFFFSILTVFNESCRQDDFIPASSQLFLPYICPFPFLVGETWLYVRGSFCGLCPVLVW